MSTYCNIDIKSCYRIFNALLESDNSSSPVTWHGKVIVITIADAHTLQLSPGLSVLFRNGAYHWLFDTEGP